MANKREFLTNGMGKQTITVQTDNKYPNPRNIPGDSVDEFSVLKDGNQYLAEKEIGQQNENG
ncbi:MULTISPECIES: hypothetical protein [Peribacillus]|uniref:hypothetical protein n=1 Tax=Peribacillus TaxID=2675229 RepID=UPI0007772918|nr:MULTISPECIES: hypothetical protein [Peribacillus]AMM93827.1 hypothetical protein UP17_16195 [Peribacillus simplex]MDF9760606.1 hypothetical protein [Peribacillus simplex]MDV7766116.1 hypothetical protein [Peribacillus sp. CSMR9]MDW7614576.1 hypothetical protein [Peribacillus simplex]RRN73132.1 hypothetical protein EI200_05930 [Peribacillus simplex]